MSKKRCTRHEWAPLFREPRTPCEAINSALKGHREKFVCRKCGRPGFIAGRGRRRHIDAYRSHAIASVLAEAKAWNEAPAAEEVTP